MVSCLLEVRDMKKGEIGIGGGQVKGCQNIMT